MMETRYMETERDAPYHGRALRPDEWPLPEPAIMVMHDYRNIDPATRPAWGPVGSWMWWAWFQLQPDRPNIVGGEIVDSKIKWDIIEDYLTEAARLGKPVALSPAMLYPGPNQDCTPQWVYGPGGKGWDVWHVQDQTYPAWNHWAWDAAYRNYIMALGEKLDGDPRIHSIWITTALAGETVLSQKDGGLLEGHNPVRFFLNAMNWHRDAFSKTPLVILATGSTERRLLAEYAMSQRIDVKHNSLHRDKRTDVKDFPEGSGQIQVAQYVMSMGRRMGYEHFYGANAPETLWAMITGIANGMGFLDLPYSPSDHLGVLASLDLPGYGKLWDWTLRMMGMPHDQIAMWVGRDTDVPVPYYLEHGYHGPWIRGDIEVNAVGYSPLSDMCRQVLPPVLRDTIYAHGGVGKSTGAELTAKIAVRPGPYKITTIYAPATNASAWRVKQSFQNLDGVMLTEVVLVDEPCWVHSIVVEPASPDDPPPPPPPNGGDDDEDPTLEEAVVAIQELLIEQGNWLSALSDQGLDNTSRIEKIEECLDKMEEALDIKALIALVERVSEQEALLAQVAEQFVGVKATLKQLDEATGSQNDWLVALGTRLAEIEALRAKLKDLF